MQILLSGKIPITTFLKNNEFSQENLKQATSRFFNDYIKKVNEYLKNKL